MNAEIIKIAAESASAFGLGTLYHRKEILSTIFARILRKNLKRYIDTDTFGAISL